MADDHKVQVNPTSLDPEHELPEPGDDEVIFLEEEDEAAARAAARTVAQSAPPAAAGEVQKLQAERDQLFDRLARLQAEFDNYRKRMGREQQEFREYALADALTLLLPVLDSFDRALQARTGEESDLRAGVELMHKQLHDTLSKLGLHPVESVGRPFDPHLHQAVEMVETGDAGDNTVLEELQRGYKLRDRLLRPAMVRVAHNPGK